MLGRTSEDCSKGTFLNRPVGSTQSSDVVSGEPRASSAGHTCRWPLSLHGTQLCRLPTATWLTAGLQPGEAGPQHGRPVHGRRPRARGLPVPSPLTMVLVPSGDFRKSPPPNRKVPPEVGLNGAVSQQDDGRPT